MQLRQAERRRQVSRKSWGFEQDWVMLSVMTMTLIRRTLAVLLPLLGLVLLSACDSKQDTFKHEAQAFCEVHKMEHWKDYKNTGSFSDFQNELVNRIGKVLVSEEFRDIFKRLSEDDSRPDPYRFFQSEIKKLTGEDWDCPEVQAIWSVKWSKASAQASDGQDSPAVSIEIKNNGDYWLNQKRIDAKHKNALASILLQADISNSPVELLIGDDVSEQQVRALLDTLTKLKVKHVNIKATGKNTKNLDWLRQHAQD